MWAPGRAPARSRLSKAVTPSTSPDLIGHTGQVQTSGIVWAIYWGPQWGTQPFTGDKETGITSLLQGIGGSNYQNIWSEYYTAGIPPTYITNQTTYEGSFTDHSTPPSGDLYGQFGVVGTEVCNVLSANHVTPSPNDVYLVYSTTPSDNICGWHNSGSCGSTKIFFAYILDMDNSQCATKVPIVAGHSVGLSGLANATAHELSEAITDPAVLVAWSDPQELEMADLCQFEWRGPNHSTTLSNGAVFALQDLWSNNANDQGYGYADVDNLGGHGCVPPAPWTHVVTWITSGNNPSQATIMNYCTWTANAAGGTAPYTYAWQAIGTNLFDTPNGASVTVYKFDSGSYQLQLTVKDAKGQLATISRPVYMTSFGTGDCIP